VAVDVASEDERIGLGPLGEGAEDPPPLLLIAGPLVHAVGLARPRPAVDPGHHHLLREHVPPGR
jgi:hypothetical protein